MSVTSTRWIPDLSCRAVSAELMDDLAADEGLLFATLRDFKNINACITQVRHLIRTTIIADMQRRNAREVSFLDIAAMNPPSPLLNQTRAISPAWG